MRRAAALVALAVALPSAASAATLNPSQWPAELGLGSAPNAIRFGGIDRYQTSLAMSLALRGAGGFPFDTPDRTSGGADSLATAAGWWGASSCPSSIIVVAGDTPADALAAAPLSDPTNSSDEPRLRRVAAADPLFDPVGGFDRVDTEAAPIIVTRSTRSGAARLSAPARIAASDLASGGCLSAREAIIVGGSAAVPVGVEDELVSLGYEEVFRVAGTDRFATAADIALALGTEPAPTEGTCLDPIVADGRTEMGFYANAVIEFRPDATTCRLQGRSVVLADGVTGADALAAGWWTSYWQVPVLLVDGDGSLPESTRTALRTMSIDSLVVLGGTARIPEATVDEAKRLAGAVAGRFAGADRYETSAIMARVFGGWHPTDDAADVVADRVCVAASGGRSELAGWPDALAAGPWCGRLAVDSSTRPSPARALEPIDSALLAQPARAPAHDAAPILLVPAGAVQPTRAVADLLSSLFISGGRWCRGGFVGACRMPGFAAAFGGSASVSDSALASMSVLLSGGDDAQRGADPAIGPPIVTDLDLRPVFQDAGGDGTSRACFARGTVAGVRWLAVYDERVETFVTSADIVGRRDLFHGDASAPLCVNVSRALPRAVVGLSAAGWATGTRRVPGAADTTVSMSDPVHTLAVGSSGEPGPSEAPDTTTSWRFHGHDDDTPATVTDHGVVFTVESASIELVLTRPADGAPRFVADISVSGGGRTLFARADGEAVLLGDRWELAGVAAVGGAVGGFRASLLTSGTDAGGDDDLLWRLDGVE